MSAGKHTGGWTVVELLISLATGLLVMLAASALLISTNGNYLNQAEAARLDDSGRYALDTISRAVRQSAFVNWDSSEAPVGTQPDDSASIGGLDARGISKGSHGIGTPLASSVNGSDVLAVRYFGAGIKGEGDGSVINCAGFGVGAAQTEAERGWSIFYVAPDSAGEAELRCKYRGDKSWGADAIVRGIDTFQVLYGLDSDDPADGVVNRYVNASAIDALDDKLALSGVDTAARARDKNRKTHWKRVVSIKIALLLHGERGSRQGSVPGHYDLFGKEYADLYGGMDPGTRIDEERLPLPMRQRARHLVVATILLRNPPG
ncbi:PilW family protein [Janthinobacterium agaricidamnosum]|uniref:PilW type IV pilus assembly protein n=1 Tax=Janthinobacterium agaricidamnosum NBRC 102515 = DSM 9628 TaxID=1349767 RepID=W0V6H8_9BURK|nr:PilW family protein [Janthinobacterium agaricidamnosum]CDG84429.1 pilW type IV pilus assembly protein [Janthinobacterium agaricidamnosum NBRC 102515 = DSM 9628]